MSNPYPSTPRSDFFQDFGVLEFDYDVSRYSFVLCGIVLSFLLFFELLGSIVCCHLFHKVLWCYSAIYFALFFFLLWFSNYTHVMILQLSHSSRMFCTYFFIYIFFLLLVAVDFYSDSLIFFSAMSVLLMNPSKIFIISVIVNV